MVKLRGLAHLSFGFSFSFLQSLISIIIQLLLQQDDYTYIKSKGITWESSLSYLT